MLVVQSHISSSSAQDRYLGGIKGELRRSEKVTDKGMEDKKNKEMEEWEQAWATGEKPGEEVLTGASSPVLM